MDSGKPAVAASGQLEQDAPATRDLLVIVPEPFTSSSTPGTAVLLVAVPPLSVKQVI